MKASLYSAVRGVDIPVFTVQLEQELLLEMPNGVRLHLPPYTTLYLPASLLAGSSASVRLPTGEQSTFVFSTQDNVLIGMPTPQMISEMPSTTQ